MRLWWLFFDLFVVIHGFMIPLSPHNIGNEPPLCIWCENAILQQETNTLACAWFGRLNLVSGERHYTACTNARQDPEKCGEGGQYFLHRYNTSSSSSGTS